MSGNRKIIKLNKKFRKKKNSTDVLSFPFHNKKNSSLDYDKKFTLFNNQLNKVRLIKIKKNEPLKSEINHFLECIKNKKLKCKTGSKHSINILEVMHNINKK